MVSRRTKCAVLVVLVLSWTGTGLAAQPQQVGSIRGVVYDKEFRSPLFEARVKIVETGQTVKTEELGNFVFNELPPGHYTLVFSRNGYTRQIKADVAVLAGQLTDVDVWLSGEFTEMEEFIVQDILQLGAGSEAALLQLRFESPSLMDSISADLMSQAGASDAAGALKLVTGASLKDGKTAVIRGLPDRYVSSQMNGVRLPTADEDKRAVELDQFPAAVIESIQVSKTFTPDQQGDASGGAVNIRLKGIPDRPFFVQLKSQVSINSQVRCRDDFLTYHGGGVGFWGRDKGSRDIQWSKLGQSWDGAVGVSRGHSPVDTKWSVAGGGKHEFESGLEVGGFVDFFYERDSSFYDNGINDSLWVENPGEPMSPKAFQGNVQEEFFKTGLFDVTQGMRSVQWGGLATFGLEMENHAVNATYLYSRTTEDKATLAQDTRGKAYFFPGYDPYDPGTPGHDKPDAAPYLRTETLLYTERVTRTLQFHGDHKIPIRGLAPFHAPELDWVAAFSKADLNQPDKRQFGAFWTPERQAGPILQPPTWSPYKPKHNVNLGNLQRIWKRIQEDSSQYAANLKMPFEAWADRDGYLKFGGFFDRVTRRFDQESFSNFEDNTYFYRDFSEFWSASFPFENHPVTASLLDVDYTGSIKINAGYGMAEIPLTEALSLTGGVRFETTDIRIVNEPEKDVTWYPRGATAPVKLNPGDGDVDINENSILPAIALEYKPWDHVTLRGSYSETVARQTFKELTPIMQQEFLGGPIFIGNPDLGMSSLRNFDVRVDTTPFEGGLFSVSWFHKDVRDPIEYVQKVVEFTYTTPVNYPRGQLSGLEFELRQKMGHIWESLEGLSLGANATFIESEVKLPADEIEDFNQPNIKAPLSRRPMTNAPDYLYNFHATYDYAPTKTQLSLFYTVEGDTLLAGAGVSSQRLVPSVYATERNTLNLSLVQRLGEYVKLRFRVKNLTNPKYKTVYRSKYIDGDATRTSFTKGIEYSLTLSVDVPF